MSIRRCSLALAVPGLIALGAPQSPAQDPLFVLEGDAAGDRLGYFRGFTALPDLDGDGFRELAVGAAKHDGPNGVDSGRAQLLSGRTRAVLRTWDGAGPSDSFGRTVEDALDLDGDGVHDVAVAAFAWPNNAFTGKVYLYSGASGALLREWEGEHAGDFFGANVRAVGDATGDGVNDLLIAAPEYQTAATGIGAGCVYLYSGADGSLARSWIGLSGSSLGLSVGRLGFDVDGDGAEDFAVGATEVLGTTPWGPGHVYVYSGKSATPLVTIAGAAVGDSLCNTADAGDVDGDAIPDLLVGSPELNADLGAVHLYSGADWSLLATWNGTAALPIGGNHALAGDVDGDGFGDVLLGDSTHVGTPIGALALCSGRTGRVLTTWHHELAGESFGFPARGAGDLDGDGIPDQLTDAPTFDGVAGADCGALYAFQGNDLYLDVTPSAAQAGDTVTLTTTAGVPGNLLIDVVTALDAAPLFVVLGPAQTFDANGECALAGAVPPGLGAHVLTLRSFAIGRAGKLIDSSPRALVLQ